MAPSRLRAAREAAGLGQSDLAARAGVSRQLVGAVEGGRHRPRVDSALALADALGLTVESLFGELSGPIDVASGGATQDGAMVRVGRVGDQLVTAPIRVGPEGWDPADGIVDRNRFTPFGSAAPGIVVGGCEPGLVLLERILREGGVGALAVTLTSKDALQCLAGGRLHAAVVHGSKKDLATLAKTAVGRFHLARWRVGLAARPDAATGWWRQAMSGRVPVVQREPGAGVQVAFRRAVSRSRRPVPGPVANSHIEAGRLAMAMDLPAVTIEPAAKVVGAAFHAIEVHSAELWVAESWIADQVFESAMQVLSGAQFQRQLARVGGYDLEGSGGRAS